MNMTREELCQSITEDCVAIPQKFAGKNVRYGQGTDGFWNFTQGAQLCYGKQDIQAIYQMLFSYASKHIVTLAAPDSIINDPEFEDRCSDIALYFLIARAMKKSLNQSREEAYAKFVQTTHRHKD